MDRRSFCFHGASLLALSVLDNGATEPSDDIYALWSLLIRTVQPQPGRGYMVADQTVIPDGLPYALTGTRKSALQKAIDSAMHKGAGYETLVPVEAQAVFSEARAEAAAQQEIVPVEHRLELPKRYRLLSTSDIKAYIDLSPHVTFAGWKPDPRALHHYKGWNQISFLSLPYFSQSRDFAIIWAGTQSGCYDWSWFFFRRINRKWERLPWETERRNECA